MKRRYTVGYLDKRGAGCMRRFDEFSKLCAFLSKLRLEANVRDESGRKIGGVEYQPGYADDGRIKWQWWVEKP